ncbi:MAG: ribosome hibernation-promoting factor, HPF/YfiA family [Armatimonadota bacterium]
MRISVRGKNVDVSDALERYAEKKVVKLEKYFPNLREAVVTQSVQRNQHIVEVTLEGDGILLRGEERSDSMYASIDLVVEKLETQIRKFKGKLMDRAHPDTPPKEEVSTIPSEMQTEVPEIVRTKRFALKPMSPDEAAMQMEMIGHDFFVFMNSDTNIINVIYKRRDGNYGLIEPEL